MDRPQCAPELADNGLNFSESLAENVQVLVELENQFKDTVLHNSPAKCLQSAELETQLASLKNEKDALLKKMAQYVELVETWAKQSEAQAKQPALDQLRQTLEATTKACDVALRRQKTIDQERSVIAKCKEAFCQRMNSQTNVCEENFKKYEDLILLLRGLSDVYIRPCAEKRQVVVELLSPEQAENVDSIEFVRMPATSNSEQRLEVTLKFRPNSLETQLAAVNVNVESLDISDLASTATASNDILWLMKSIKQRWAKHCRLVDEIDSLRHRFALDWLYNEGLIRIIYGPNASIVCTVRLDPHYPYCASGGVTLLTACGLPSGITKDMLQIPPTFTLKEALEFLANQLSNAKTQ